MSKLLKAVYQNAPDLPQETRRLLAAGDDPNVMTEYGESPLRVACSNGRFDVLRLLLDAGADEQQLGWGDLHRLVAFGSVAQMKAQLQQHGGRDARDYWEHTPLLLAIAVGDTAKVGTLLAMGCELGERGRCGKTALQYPAQQGNVEMLGCLLQQGLAVDEVDEFGDSALMTAVEYDQPAAVQFLLQHGANWRQEKDIEQRAIHYARSKAVIELLLDAGDSASALNTDQLGLLLGLDPTVELQASEAEFKRAARRQFGLANPQETNHAFWLAMIRTGGNAWRARKAFGVDSFSEIAGPVWCFDRFGRSVSRLPDGRVIVVAGEHEDYYDPDFCIYNDVVVFLPNGEIEIYSYPEEVFPPTDFHTATLVGESIYLIGSLGYSGRRQPGYTQVYRLNTRTYRIERLQTRGEMPGWISRHEAELVDGAIVVRGGKLIVQQDGQEDYVDNDAIWRLTLASLRWSKLDMDSN